MRGVGLAAAFGAGLISITSPCCLPLLPGYLGYLTGLDPAAMGARRGRTVAAALLFAAGFTAVFVTLGATASELGFLVSAHRALAERAAGAFIVLMGVALVLEGRFPFLGRSAHWAGALRGGSLATAAPLGAAFAITWTPCIGPILGAILALAGSAEDLASGVALLFVYSLGLAVPFVLLSLAVARAHRFLRRAARVTAGLQVVAGAILVGMGLLLLTGRWLPVIAPVLDAYARLHWPPV